jgi:hypothetical protein
MAALVALAALAIGVQAAAAAKPAEVSQPTIEGVLRQDRTVSAGTGIWGNTPTSFTYQWHRCPATGAGCSPVTGQTASTYGIGSADVGSTLVVVVTATNADGSTSANSKPSAVVSANILPANTVAPAVTGTAEVGSPLTTTAGTWTGGPATKVQWQRCDKAGKSCSAIEGATGTLYGVLQTDIGSTLVSTVTATNDIGVTSASSAATAVVAPLNGAIPKEATQIAGGETSVPASSIALPQRLVLSKVTLTPLTIASRTSPVTVKLRVTDTRGYAVSNALVTVTVVPSDRASIGAAQRTAADGWVTFTLTPKAALSLKKGTTVTLHVRATKDGDTALAGVSATRLVQVKVKPA